MKRYIIAITSTILIPFLALTLKYIAIEFKKLTGDDMQGFYILCGALGCGSFVLNIVLWISALKQKDIKDL